MANKSEFSINRAECAIVFIVMLNPFVIAAILFAVVYGLLIAYPYMYKENEAVVFDVEEGYENSSGKTRWIGDLQHFQSKVEGIEI